MSLGVSLGPSLGGAKLAIIIKMPMILMFQESFLELSVESLVLNLGLNKDPDR